MKWTLCPLDVATDLPRVAELMSLVEAETVTEEILRDREKKWSEKGVRQRLVAVDETGQVLAYAHARRWDYEKPERFGVMTIVDVPCRNRGIGTRLHAEMEGFAQAQGAKCLRVYVRDNDGEGQRFAERQGFRVDHHMFESVRDISDFDPSPFSGTVEAVEVGGIRFFTFADTDGSEAAQRKLYELNTTTGYDQPDGKDEPARPFEQFATDVFGGYWFRPDGQIFAADGDRWIGMAAVGEIYPGVMYNMHTGVLREYRGRGIAQALKLLALEFCRKHNARLIRTNNDSRNAPMLAINQKLGYRPEPGWHILLKEIA